MGDTNSTPNATQSESIPPSSSHEGSQSQCVSSRLKRKASRSRSEACEHFNKFFNEQGDLKASYNYCDREFLADTKRNETTALKSRIVVCKKRINAGDDLNRAELVFESGDGSSNTWKFNQDAIRKSIAEMIILDELPFKFVEGRGFRHFMALACPKFCVPSRWTVARDCYQLYVDEKIKLKQLLKASCVRVSLTTDTWTSLQGINYLCLTAHFIDNDWKLNKRILNFCPISSHKGEAIGKMIEKCLRDWGIDRVFTITVDNASSNDVAISYLKRKFNNLGTCIREGKYLHLRCITHILNLIVNDELKEMDESVARVRGAVRYVRQTPSRLAQFKECVLIEKIQSKSLLCLDVSTRWNSTYLMLDAAQKFEKVFEAFDDVDPFYKSELMMGDGVPKKEDWENVRRLCLFLQKFYAITIKVSGSSYVSYNTFLDDICIVYSTLRDWQTNSNVELNAMAKRMKDKFDKYWGNVEKMNILLYIASILDPRKKLEFVRFCFFEMYSPEQASVMINNVKDAIEELFDEYKKMLQPQCENVSESSKVRPITEASKFGLRNQKEDKFMLSKFKKYKKEIGIEDNKTELDRFLSYEDAKDDDDFDVLIWWKLNSRRFPILSNIARDVLAAPISAVASESAFSTSGRMLDAYRSSLTPKLVQSLICAQNWLRGSSRFDDIEEDLAGLDKVDMELSNIALDVAID